MRWGAEVPVAQTIPVATMAEAFRDPADETADETTADQAATTGREGEDEVAITDAISEPRPITSD